MNIQNHNNATDDSIPDKILVVEDDESLRILIQRRLNRAGFSTEGISNGTDALDKITNHVYRLLLLDYTLPDMSGEQFARKLAVFKYDIPFIVITGQENETIVDEMVKLGAREYVVKDDTFFNSLLHSIRKILG